ncbi:hypothetical protein IW136_002074 [Coemansia sp. RSA 678]|nr:hypothetical protein IW136_002074 [Coemansia sp. RSA 678]
MRSSIRWYDLRAPNSGETMLYVPMADPESAGTAASGTVYDLQFDPFNSMRYMAHDRSGLVNMWDIRWATKPVHTFNTGQKTVQRMQFSPRRSGVIASLAADSSVFEIIDIKEFFNGRVAQNERLDARVFLDDARMKDHYDDDDRMALLSTPPPEGIRIWADQTTTVLPPAAIAELHTAFLWVPPAISARTRCHHQLVSSTASGALHTTALPLPYIGVTNCRGDMTISNNWSKLLSTLPNTEQEMDLLHMAVPEIHEVVLDKSSRQSHSTQSTTAGARGSRLALPVVSAAISASASLSSVQHVGYQQGSSGGLLARRHKAARQNSADGDLRATQLRDRLRTMNLGLGSSGAGAQSAPTGESGAKLPSPHTYERATTDMITYNPTGGEECASNSVVEAAMASDILVMMRQHALQGYGTNADKNVHMFEHDMKKRDMWQWVRDAQIRRHSGVHYVGYGVDASFYGVHDILRLKRKELKYLYRQSTWEAQRRKHATWLGQSRLGGQRLLALHTCGWGLDGPVREQHIRALEAAGKFSVAAGTAFIYGDHARCLLALERSPAQDQKLLSFMLKAQLGVDNRIAPAPTAGTGALPPGDMFGCPHLQMIFMYLATDDWGRVIANMSRLPLSYRLAVALRYLDDASMLQSVVSAGRRAVRNGDLDGLLVTGVSGGGRLVMQAYVDATADVQTAALVSIFDPANDAVSAETAEKWIYAYRHLLNMWRMFTTRCLFDIAHGNSSEDKGLARVSDIGQRVAVHPADLRCTYCHQSLDYDRRKNRTLHGSGGSTPGVTPGVPIGVTAAPGPVGPGIGGLHGGNKNSGSDARLHHTNTAPPLIGQKSASSDARRKDLQQAQTRLLYTHCSRCNSNLPRCVICRMKLGTLVAEPAEIYSDFAQWFSWCQTCGHGGHTSHMQSWFTTHAECPVPACTCQCDLRD